MNLAVKHLRHLQAIKCHYTLYRSQCAVAMKHFESHLAPLQWQTAFSVKPFLYCTNNYGKIPNKMTPMYFKNDLFF